MNDDRMPPEPQRQLTEHMVRKGDHLREAAERDRGLAEEAFMLAEAARNGDEGRGRNKADPPRDKRRETHPPPTRSDLINNAPMKRVGRELRAVCWSG